MIRDICLFSLAWDNLHIFLDQLPKKRDNLQKNTYAETTIQRHARDLSDELE